MKYKTVLNPFKYGIYSIELISHKLLRWLIPFFLLMAAIGVVILAQMKIELFQWLLLLGILFTWSVLIGKVFKDSPACPSVLLFPYYFYLVNISSMKGVLQSLHGTVQVTWSTPRENRTTIRDMSAGSLLVVASMILITGLLFVMTLQSLL